jgi:hypothetical protein
MVSTCNLKSPSEFRIDPLTVHPGRSLSRTAAANRVFWAGETHHGHPSLQAQVVTQMLATAS